MTQWSFCWTAKLHRRGGVGPREWHPPVGSVAVILVREKRSALWRWLSNVDLLAPDLEGTSHTAEAYEPGLKQDGSKDQRGKELKAIENYERCFGAHRH